MSATTFVVDPEHPGVSEADWATSPASSLPPLSLPAHRRVVVVAPHPDDEVLGAGGLLARLASQGTDIRVLGVTDGEACFGPIAGIDPEHLRRQRQSEVEVALTRLGLDPARRSRLRLPDGGLRRADVEWHLQELLGPDVLCIAPWTRDGHPDHDAVGQAAVTAAGATGALLLQYLVWAWHWADPTGVDIPWTAARRVDLSRRETATKRWATAAFASQTRWPTATGVPVLPGSVRARFRRPWEMYLLCR